MLFVQGTQSRARVQQREQRVEHRLAGERPLVGRASIWNACIGEGALQRTGQPGAAHEYGHARPRHPVDEMSAPKGIRDSDGLLGRRAEDPYRDGRMALGIGAERLQLAVMRDRFDRQARQRQP